MKIQPAITDLYFRTNPGTDTDENNSHRHYIDTAKQLSKVNRRLYSQARMYGYQGLTFIWRQDPTNPLATIEVSVRTAGNTWILQNAFVKGKALWHQMQELVLEDNPSIKGKWHDFKVRLCSDQVTRRELEARDGQGALYLDGEWNLSTYVLPQHDVQVTGPDAGQPEAPDYVTANLLGDDTSSTRSLVKAYQDSRATVQADMPNVPPGMSTSFFNLLTDSGSQEPELAAEIEAENDNPPYDIDNYPGGAGNASEPVTVQYSAISSSEVDGRTGAFVAPCGLIELEIVGRDATGSVVAAEDMPVIDLLLHVAPGTYKGVAAVDMGQ